MKLKPLIALAGGAALVAILAVSLPGCGPGMSKTQAKVIGTDGKPIANAQVTLIPQDPDAPSTSSGLTDDSGVCTLETAGKKGVPKGKYKALVIKAPEVKGGGQEGDIMQKMKDQMKMPMGGGAGGLGPVPSGFKSELNAKYADAKTTPFVDITVPAPSGMIELVLKD